MQAGESIVLALAQAQGVSRHGSQTVRWRRPGFCRTAGKLCCSPRRAGCSYRLRITAAYAYLLLRWQARWTQRRCAAGCVLRLCTGLYGCVVRWLMPRTAPACPYQRVGAYSNQHSDAQGQGLAIVGRRVSVPTCEL